MSSIGLWNCFRWRVGTISTWDWFNVNMPSSQYRNANGGDKTVLRPSYLHNGISYTGKTTSWYWIIAKVGCRWSRNTQGQWVVRVLWLLHRKYDCVKNLIETSSALLALCAGNPSVIDGFPHHKGSVMRRYIPSIDTGSNRLRFELRPPHMLMTVKQWCGHFLYI